MRRLVLMLMLLVMGGLLVQPARAQIQLGDAVTTRQGTAASDIVFRYFHVQNANAQPLNVNWPAPAFADPTWNYARLGSIFGVALDNSGNSYVTAASCYGGAVAGLGGNAGSIYRIDGVTNAVTNWASIPNTGPALGNICFDPQHNNGQFFVTNHEDGKIYRISAAGVILSSFDPFSPDNGTKGFAPRGERLWGIAYYNNRVYFARWREDCGFPNPNVANEIHSIGLNLAGDFTGATTLEITLPPLTGLTHSNPVSDIEITRNATPVRMLLGERTMYSDLITNAHAGRVLEYIRVGTAWVPSTATFSIGVAVGSACPPQSNPFIANSTGGVDYGYYRYDKAAHATVACDSAVWTLGDALHFTSGNIIYGLQRLPRTGGSIANSVLIDYDGNTAADDKARLGDVDIYRQCGTITPDPCTSKTQKLTFAVQQGFCCCWDVNVTNTLPSYWTNIRIDVLTPGVTIGGATAPTGWAVAPTPLSAIWTHNSGFVPTGASGPLRFCINPGPNSLQVLQLSWIGPQGVICRDTLHLDCAPNPTKGACPCGALIVDSLVCKTLPGTTISGYQMYFKLKNNSIFPMSNATVNVTSPVGAAITPGNYTFATINPGFTSTQMNGFISGAGPGQICFSIQLCAPLKTTCCTFDTCIVLPPCKKNCCDPLKVSVNMQLLFFNVNAGITNKVTSNANLQQFSATLVSASQQIICPFAGPITPIPSIINPASFNTTPAMTPSSFGTGEVIWESTSGSGSVPAPGPSNMNLTVQLPLPPGDPRCRDIIRLCIRYSYTDIDCHTCDTLICYQFSRRALWWGTPFPVQNLPFKVGGDEHPELKRDEKQDRSTLSSAPSTSPIRIDMIDANHGILSMNSPAPGPDDEPSDIITVVGITLEPAVGTDLTALHDDLARSDAEILDRVANLTLAPSFPQGTTRTFTLTYDNYEGALAFPNYLKLIYYRGEDSENLQEDAIVVYARVPNPGGQQDELNWNEGIDLQTARTYALSFKNVNAAHDNIARVEVGVEEGKDFSIIAIGPGLNPQKVGLQAYRKPEDKPHLQMEQPGESQAMTGAVRPGEEVTPIFVTVIGKDEPLTFTYTTYAENGEVVSEGTLVAKSPLLPGTSGVGPGTGLWNEAGFVGCYPNPMTKATTFEFQLPKNEPEVWLAITDLNGLEIARLVDGVPMNAGQHRTDFDVSALPNGTYFYTLRTGSFSQTRRMQIVR